MFFTAQNNHREAVLFLQSIVYRAEPAGPITALHSSQVIAPAFDPAQGLSASGMGKAPAPEMTQEAGSGVNVSVLMRTLTTTDSLHQLYLIAFAIF